MSCQGRMPVILSEAKDLHFTVFSNFRFFVVRLLTASSE
jgi:hypothetical protein